MQMSVLVLTPSPSHLHRLIRHPNFQNIHMMEATEKVKNEDVGACIIRPSARSPNELCMTLKVGFHIT